MTDVRPFKFGLLGYMSMVGKPVRDALASKLALHAELEKSLEGSIKG